MKYERRQRSIDGIALNYVTVSTLNIRLRLSTGYLKTRLSMTSAKLEMITEIIMAPKPIPMPYMQNQFWIYAQSIYLYVCPYDSRNLYIQYSTICLVRYERNTRASTGETVNKLHQNTRQARFSRRIEKNESW